MKIIPKIPAYVGLLAKRIETKVALYIACLSCFCQLSVCGQITEGIKFTTPEVSAFNRNFETPVSLYTGVPNINIPLFEIKIKGVTVPITLDYHAGGIRVDQEATWVGLGWNLNYGGEISRKIRGIADEYRYMNTTPNSVNTVSYFMTLPNITYAPVPSEILLRWDKVKEAKYALNDYMPDEFYYSVLGYSGRFMFSQPLNKFVLFPKEDIVVEKQIVGSGSDNINFWNLKLPNGTSVELGKNGYTAGDTRAFGPKIVRNSWLIKTIRNSYNDSIAYDYDNFSYVTTKLSGQYYKRDSRLGYSGSTDFVDANVSDSRLKSISYSGGRLEFVTMARDDMPAKALSQIRAYDLSGKLIKTIELVYSYFTGSDFDILPTVNPILASGISNNYKYKRLRLDAVKITVPGKDPLQYTFEYNTLERMPSKYTFSQDHYGFYNDIDNDRVYGFIPTLSNFYVGGDRRVRPNAAKAFSLKSITFPEKGKAEFIYEGNTSGILNIPDDLLANYQDDNFLEKYSAISVSSYSRLTSYPSPDQTINDTRYFRKRFTVGGSGFPTFKKNWSIGTNFGLSAIDANLPAFANNVEFLLERINPGGSRTLVKRFNTTDMNSGSSVPPPRIGQDEDMVSLMVGEYEMTVAMTYSTQPNTPADNQPYNLSFFISWREMNPQNMMVNVGGLRIKDINYYNNDNLLVKKKSYSYTNPGAMPSNPNYTSGQVVSFPQYFDFRISKTGLATETPKISWIEYFTSNSVIPLESTAGSSAGYEYVDEFDVDFNDPTKIFRTNSHFSFDRPYFSSFYSNRTKGLVEPMEWVRGKLLDRQYYKGNNLIKSEKIEYNHLSPHLNSEEAEEFTDELNTDLISFQSLNIFNDMPEDFYDVDGYLDNCVYFRYSPYNNFTSTAAGKPTMWGGVSNTTCSSITVVPYFKRYTGFDKPKKRTTVSYDNPNTPVTTIEEYSYEKTPTHHQLTKTKNTSSSGSTTTLENKYAQDVLRTGAEEMARLLLVNKHMVDTKMEEIATKNGTQQISKTDYQVDAASSLVFPKLTSTNTGVGGIMEDRISYVKFDDRGNLLSTALAKGTNTSYKWGYNKQYPVAEIKNASLNQFYYQNFEEKIVDYDGGTLDSTRAHTGRYSIKISNSGPGELYRHSTTILPVNLTAKRKFTFSGWIYSDGPSVELHLFMKKSGETGYFTYNDNVLATATNKWVYLQKEFEVPADVANMFLRLDNNAAGNVWFDDLRIQPSDASMTTYTYQPLVGMTSSTDDKGMTTYYEYDEFQRLKNIKDQTGNIVKSYDYHYKP